ncbi:hypothetical protein K437DRAFT_150706 [Tilletiaria anomala UBC 951]|uniref:Uncharacterized protein n=1 Tax=Tilletiaria anomala (strain ATCC 24038 / CBS 436.72 / UBC 951) TaxID=1037660 RepID=A0A066WPH8_TILAU|nr:uncharacterized protein K437DRAFT_150706 [Tilletiaria anomala UBC 951]KDN52884.1 hypothetical protein K437DRAFT_150706 [Tilletiaria anomala UBC 951]
MSVLQTLPTAQISADWLLIHQCSTEKWPSGAGTARLVILVLSAHGDIAAACVRWIGVSMSHQWLRKAWLVDSSACPPTAVVRILSKVHIIRVVRDVLVRVNKCVDVCESNAWSKTTRQVILHLTQRLVPREASIFRAFTKPDSLLFILKDPTVTLQQLANARWNGSLYSDKLNRSAESPFY